MPYPNRLAARVLALACAVCLVSRVQGASIITYGVLFSDYSGGSPTQWAESFQRLFGQSAAPAISGIELLE